MARGEPRGALPCPRRPMPLATRQSAAADRRPGNPPLTGRRRCRHAGTKTGARSRARRRLVSPDPRQASSTARGDSRDRSLTTGPPLPDTGSARRARWSRWSPPGTRGRPGTRLWPIPGRTMRSFPMPRRRAASARWPGDDPPPPPGWRAAIIPPTTLNACRGARWLALLGPGCPGAAVACQVVIAGSIAGARTPVSRGRAGQRQVAIVHSRPLPPSNPAVGGCTGAGERPTVGVRRMLSPSAVVPGAGAKARRQRQSGPTLVRSAPIMGVTRRAGLRVRLRQP